MQKEYSLWMIPSNPAYGQLLHIIQTLSRGQNVTPFIPHMTLLSGLTGDVSNISARVNELVYRFEVPHISLGEIRDSNSLYKAVFYTVEPNPRLAQIQAGARDMFRSNQEFDPSLSLLYAGVSEKVRKGILDDLRKVQSPGQFLAENITLYETTNGPTKWEKVRDFALLQ